MKRKNKGKIHPSPSAASAPPPPPPPPAAAEGKYVLPVLNLLPSAVLALALVLSLEDQEVLAYMITHFMKTPAAAAATTSASATDTPTGKKKAFRKPAGGGVAHRPPIFHCDCFDCYTAYWLRWDSSPGRELIHQAIEAFEDHLASAERQERGGKQRKEKSVQPQSVHGGPPQMPDDQKSPALSQGKDGAALPERREEEEDDDDLVVVELSEELQGEQVAAEDDGCTNEEAAPARGGEERRGLIRKMLPDVVGLLNSRFWKLWSPSV
ncbi:uncharacterized protein LOC116200576 [Punica granatum]|uniref:Uncharacterized protein n=2 Tax=Punica granatum TaxID=22663 RepID=A0A218XYB6_PUNGR|nr:uncharacterized protein LOC116200576 [Punica granatum]OWM89788.1 hypothetical protein CDL15_Pgr024536 [Punica granatum]PKI54228.1 hypothetical protein CRG98_025382 [Punica granatum]